MLPKIEFTTLLEAEAVQRIFDIVRKNYIIEDFKERLGDVLDYENTDIVFTEEEFAAMADDFFINHDCNIPDNVQYYNILEKAIKEKKGEQA